MSTQPDPQTKTVTVASTEAIITARAAGRSSRESLVRKLLRDPQAIITATILLVVLVLGIFAPLLAQHGPNESDLSMVNAPPGTPGYLLGGDESGRDILSRLLYSANTAALSALIGTSVALTIGVVFGLIGGFFGAVIRNVSEWVFNLLMTLPSILLLIILMPLTGGDYRWTMLIFGVMLSPGIFRIVRNSVIGVRNELYVDAARVAGLSNVSILGRHILGVIRGPIIIATAFLVGTAISVQSGLAFLGVGSKQDPSFGAMIASGFTNMYIAPTQLLWPALSLGLIVICTVLLGNSLRDAFEGVRPKPVKVGAGQQAAVAQKIHDEDGDALLRIRGLRIAYPSRAGTNEVVRGVDLDLRRGEVLGLVGESGSGKSQTAFATLGVLPVEAVITGGSIVFDGVDLVGMSDSRMRSIRGRQIAYIPQEPMSNLDPAYTVGSQLVEGVRASLDISRAEAKERVLALLARCGIVNPEATFASYPHQISGGMAQRVLIAGAVASRPKLLIADEPTTALDVTVQAEILDLLRELQAELDMAVLLVTHNFGVVADICDRISVMKTGEIVESGTADRLFAAPQHEYTKALLGAILDEETTREDGPSGRSSSANTAGDSE